MERLRYSIRRSSGVFDLRVSWMFISSANTDESHGQGHQPLRPNTLFTFVLSATHRLRIVYFIIVLSIFSQCGSSGLVFFIPGSSQILPVPVSDNWLNSNFINFQYLGKASVSYDRPVSTNDLQTDRIFLPLTHLGCAGKEGLVMKKGQSELTNWPS